MRLNQLSRLLLFSLLGWSAHARLLREGRDDGGAEDSYSRNDLRPGRRTRGEITTADSQGEEKGRGKKHGGLKEREERVYVKYIDEKGHARAVQHAQKIFQDADDDDIVIMSCVDCIEYLRSDSRIVEVSIDYPVEAYGLIDEPARTLEEIIPWGLRYIQADKLDAGDEEVMICIVDTGLAIGHPDFNHDFISGTDTVKDDGEVWKWNVDNSGHGTHVAGTIAALGGNDMGVAGAGNFKLHIVRALGDDGRGFESDVRRGVRQCIDAGANIINMSLGGSSMSTASENIYTEAVEELGILIIAAAGNQGSRNYFYPASHPSVISVAAVFEWGMYWGGSNWGDQIEISGPGYNILSSTISTSAIQTDDFGYAAYHITGSHGGASSGNMTYCGEGDYPCEEAADGICVMIRDLGSLRSMLKNCEEGGGVGAVVFNAENSNNYDWSVDSGVNIPAVQVSYKVGVELVMNMRDQFVTVGDANGDGQEFTYAHFTGTSMAAPHVAAAAALAWSYNLSNCTNHQIRYALAKTALDLDPVQQPGCDDDHGYGLVQAQGAKDWLAENDCSTWEVPGGVVGGCTVLGESNEKSS